MKRWVSGDCHFYHKRIAEYCGRPDNHLELIVNGLKEATRREDVLYVLGDVHFGTEGQLKDILSVIKCRKYLIRGNHDRWTDTKYMLCGFSGVFDALQIGNFYMTHVPTSPPEGKVNLHGHIHNLGSKLDKSHRLYSPELENYRPRLLESFIK